MRPHLLAAVGDRFPEATVAVHLAPVDLIKVGPRFYLPIAIDILRASGQFVADLSHGLLVGALSLDGILQRTERSFTVVMMAVENGVERAFVEDDDAREVGLIEGNAVHPMPTLAALLPHLRGEAPLTPLAPENQGTAVE